jgi:hypothetical protein
MSTDILQYEFTDEGKSREIFQIRALKRFLALTLPIMLLTFGAWYGVYYLISQREKSINKAKNRDS